MCLCVCALPCLRKGRGNQISIPVIVIFQCNLISWLWERKGGQESTVSGGCWMVSLLGFVNQETMSHLCQSSSGGWRGWRPNCYGFMVLGCHMSCKCRNEDCDVHKHQDAYGALFVPGQMVRLILSSFLVICTLSKLGWQLQSCLKSKLCWVVDLTLRRFRIQPLSLVSRGIVESIRRLSSSWLSWLLSPIAENHAVSLY